MSKSTDLVAQDVAWHSMVDARLCALTKREITRAYRCGDIGLSDAVMWLRDDYGMSHGEAFRYLGL